MTTQPTDVYDEDTEDGCRCAVARMAPCSWCESHDPACEWPDRDCPCGDTPVAAVHHELPPYQRIMAHPDLVEVNEMLEEYYR